MSQQALMQAVHLALADDWDGAHQIAQDYNTPTANWLHAVLHKIEGDVWNSQYWYARSGGRQFEDFGLDVTRELKAILQELKP